jgi:hypothetical protein
LAIHCSVIRVRVRLRLRLRPRVRRRGCLAHALSHGEHRGRTAKALVEPLGAHTERDGLGRALGAVGGAWYSKG